MVWVGLTLVVVVVVDFDQTTHLAQRMALVLHLSFGQWKQTSAKEVDWLILVEDH